MIAEDENDQQPVYVGVNGKSYFIRRGEPVAVPPEVVGVLTTLSRLYQQVKMVPIKPSDVSI